MCGECTTQRWKGKHRKGYCSSLYKEMLTFNLNELYSLQYQLTKQNKTIWLCSSRCCYGSHLFFPLLECKNTLYKNSQKVLIFVHQFFWIFFRGETIGFIRLTSFHSEMAQFPMLKSAHSQTWAPPHILSSHWIQYPLMSS